MGLAKEVLPNLGFDLDEAGGALIQWLVDARVMSEQELDQWTELVDPSDGTRRLNGGEAYVQIAMVHGQLHFAPPPVLVGPIDHVPFCSQWPCRAAASSFALWEIGDYLVDLTSGLPAYAGDLDDLAQHLSKVDPRLLSRLRDHATPQNTICSRFRPEASRAPSEPAEKRILEFVTALENAPSTLVAFAKEVRAELTSQQLHQGWSRSGGRRGDVLLTAVWQHLYAGGFAPEEIARLVPDTIRGAKSSLIDRVRTRVRGQDRRSVKPWHAGMSGSGADASHPDLGGNQGG